MSALMMNLAARIPEVSAAQAFGVVADGVTINDAALARMQAWLASQTNPRRVVMPAGVICYTTDPGFAYANAKIIGAGVVRWRYSGTGNALSFDAGMTSDTLTGFQFGEPGNLMKVEVEATGKSGVFIRGIHHGQICVDVRSSGAGMPAMEVDFAVCTDFHFVCSVNQDGGFYKGLTPSIGLKLTQRNAGELTSYCNFWRPIIEGAATGIDLDYAAGNTFYGGTVEACTSGGILETANAWRNTFIGVDMESNTNWDIDSSAKRSSYLDCDTNTEVIFNGTKLTLEGGMHQSINIQGGSRNRVIDVDMNRNGGGTYTDNGAATEHHGVYDMTNGAYLGAQPMFVIANGSGSTTYTNKAYPNGVYVSAQGGTLTTVTRTRGGVTITLANGQAAGEWEAILGDVITINWSSAPSVYGTPR